MDSFRIVKHRIPCQHIREYAHATANSQEDVLWLAVNQYIPRCNPNPQTGDVTIVGATANAFPKELYEPLWCDLLQQASQQGWRLRGIWIADPAQQGESYAINQQSVGNEPHWHDHARDLLHLINSNRAEMPQPIIGVGHSMGGNQLAALALMHPRLLTSLILLDPVIQLYSAELGPGLPASPAQASTFRRSSWPSRKAAAEAFRKSAFYRSWDSRVLDRWLDFGLRSASDGDAELQVTLATTPAQEVFTFLRPNFHGYGVAGKAIDRESHADVDPHGQAIYPFYRAEVAAIYNRLPELRPSVLYIFGDKSPLSTKQMNKDKVHRTGVGVGGSGGTVLKKVGDVTLEGVGHLIAMETPERTAEEIGRWTSSTLVDFHRSQMQWDQEWKSKPLQYKQTISDEWIKMMERPSKGPKI